MRYEDFQTSKKLSEEEIEEKAIDMGAKDIWGGVSPMTNRDSKGRFVSGNDISRLGGYARASKVPAKRLSEIGRLGWLAFVAKYFNGDEQAAKRYASDLYMWASDRPYWGTSIQKFFRPTLPPPGGDHAEA